MFSGMVAYGNHQNGHSPGLWGLCRARLGNLPFAVQILKDQTDLVVLPSTKYHSGLLHIQYVD